MEENVDPQNENRNNEDKSEMKDPIDDNKNKIHQNIIEKAPNEKNIDPNKITVSNDKDKKVNNQEVITTSTNDTKIKPKKELPIEKKPFNEFINDHLLPSLINEFKERGFEVEEINLKNTFRPIAGDKCWVVYCEIKDICNFWLSFEKNDISSLKSISLCRSNQKPSVIESFLIDERRITLNLIISRILQRLNGQKLIGIN